jgi:hypothetical protein
MVAVLPRGGKSGPRNPALLDSLWMPRNSADPWVAFPLVLLGVLLGVWTGCGGDSEPPRSFALVNIERARALVGEGILTLVEAAPDVGQRPASSGAILWRLPENPSNPTPPPEVPPGGVLLIASEARLGFRAAAALSRAGNQPVYVCITSNAEERISLYSLALQTKEVPGDRDS